MTPYIGASAIVGSSQNAYNGGAMSSVANVIEFPSARARIDQIEDELNRAVAEERLRIARDLHDVVSYSFATIKVHAGVALHLMDDAPEAIGQAVRAIDVASKEALTELRAILGMLRSSDGPDLRALTAGVDLLDGLAASMTASSVRTRVQVTGDVRPLPPNLDATAFRIAQESLSNVLQHQGPTSAVVKVGYEADCVTVEVVSEAGDPLFAASHGSGHGINGMRERVAEFGGELEAGSRPDGGFRVFARLLLFPRSS
jgi:signal transduction histidine kinase